RGGRRRSRGERTYHGPNPCRWICARTLWGTMTVRPTSDRRDSPPPNTAPPTVTSTPPTSITVFERTIEAVSLDVGGVLTVPDEGVIAHALRRHGVPHDRARFFAGHYH